MFSLVYSTFEGHRNPLLPLIVLRQSLDNSIIYETVLPISSHPMIIDSPEEQGDIRGSLVFDRR
jgi:hypothetical protein